MPNTTLFFRVIALPLGTPHSGNLCDVPDIELEIYGVAIVIRTCWLCFQTRHVGRITFHGVRPTQTSTFVNQFCDMAGQVPDGGRATVVKQKQLGQDFNHDRIRDRVDCAIKLENMFQTAHYRETTSTH